MNFTLDWRAIRPLNGSQADAFEELCAQLARVEKPADSRFERKGIPDAGVECYAVLPDDSEWGWQAKYFDALGSVQWKQLDESIKTALDKHPKIVRYFVCVPLDRSDARIKGKTSALQRWEQHVKKWAKWASAHGMSVDFVWWGSSELLERLARAEQVGRVYFWFGKRGFDPQWFQVRLDEAIKTAGPRYTPEVNVNLPLAGDFDALGRTEQFFDRISAKARLIRDEFKQVGYSFSAIKEPDFADAFNTTCRMIDLVLAGLSAVRVNPVEPLPFLDIARAVTESIVAATGLREQVLNSEAKYVAEREQEAKTRGQRSFIENPFTNLRSRLFHLESILEDTHESLEHAQTVAGANLVLLTGAAGTGKTHLLCDVAKNRLISGRPTILLMGQQFIGEEAPWTQALRHLDLPALSVEEFIGSLESAAQAARCRALLVVDAINEGAGRLIWPNHLATFLTHIERSPWIAVVLSVRSSYEEIVVPDDIRTRCVTVAHHGFADHEYNAVQTFFAYYGLELPSTPLLTPEFTNPLFLKTLCRGLQDTGRRRLPRGFHGITATFNLYLDAINKKLGETLGFNPKRTLVRSALEAFADALLSSDKRWMSLERAELLVNSELPGRDFENSMYRGLVAEGLLVEENITGENSAREEVVFIGYERFADHVFARIFLERYLDLEDPAKAFGKDGPLAFLWDRSRYVAIGLLEAMCIQVPERTGKELIELAPPLMDNWNIGEPYRQSIVWRDLSAFSEITLEILNDLARKGHGWTETHDVILTVSTLPGHPYNARFIDQRLRRNTMPDRDAWWSTYLHHAWGERGAVDRLVDWATAVKSNLGLDDEAVELCSITLAWMLTTSNRFLRDRATKALVNLLTDRLDAVTQLVERFADVDDPYVVERVYAVAYGVSTRSYDAKQVKRLADCIYNKVFAFGTPPAHILLRDYARGVVERAIWLGENSDIDTTRIRPPYGSDWPAIPSEAELEPYLPDWSDVSYDGGQPDWSRNRIGDSVLEDDFARYIIGTNFSSSQWLALRIGDPPWQSPEERMAALVSEFSAKEMRALEALNTAENDLAAVDLKQLLGSVVKRDSKNGGQNNSDSGGQQQDTDLAIAEQTRADALLLLESELTTEHLVTFRSLREEMKDHYRGRFPPNLDMRLVQRYILKRVFDLGWTIDRFGKFDRYSVDPRGRDARKAERIGKKYQWIAYHEIMAFVADHFQYRESFDDDHAESTYEGPWQESFRDIDPSCTLRSARGGTPHDGHSRAWWAPCGYDNWGDPGQSREWASRQNDLPDVQALLSIQNPYDRTRWYNVNGFLLWNQKAPPDRESTDVESRHLWYMFGGYLVEKTKSDAIVEWAKDVDFWGRWMPEPPDAYGMFLGEQCWSPAARYFARPYFRDDGWIRPDRDCPAHVRGMSRGYSIGVGIFDCSIDRGFSLNLPVCDLVTGLGLRWTGRNADWVDARAKLAVFDPTADTNGPDALLIRKDLIDEFLNRNGLTIFWTFLGEKLARAAGYSGNVLSLVEMTGAYILRSDQIEGFLRCKPEEVGGS